MMHYAQKSLLKSFSADPDKYVALPIGSGSTGAMEKPLECWNTCNLLKINQIYSFPHMSIILTSFPGFSFMIKCRYWSTILNRGTKYARNWRSNKKLEIWTNNLKCLGCFKCDLSGDWSEKFERNNQ